MISNDIFRHADIVHEIRCRIALLNLKSPSQIIDAEVRIFMIHHPEDVAKIVEKHVPKTPDPMQQGWTSDAVKRALIDAFDMLGRTEGRVGPATVRAAHIETSDGWGYADGERAGTPNQRMFNASGMNASRMDMIVVDRDSLWVAGVSNPIYRRKLQAWVSAKLRSSSIASLCKRRKWAERTFRRDVSRAVQEIADRLNKNQVQVF